ncbi:hypothetical protein HDV05_002582, partial [Chytridiales sp. JEL 0842]
MHARRRSLSQIYLSTRHHVLNLLQSILPNVFATFPPTPSQAAAKSQIEIDLSGLLPELAHLTKEVLAERIRG